MAYSTNIVYLSKAQYQELLTNQTITVNGTTITYNDNDIYVTPQAEPITDVKINGTSIGSNGIANIPIASPTIPGVIKINTTYGIGLWDNSLTINNANVSEVKAGNISTKPISPYHQHEAVFYGLSKIAGVDLRNETVTLGTYPDSSKAAIQNMLGITDLISTEEFSTATVAHAANSLFIMGGKLYKATSAIVVGDAVEAGTNCQAVKADEVFVNKKQYATSGTPGLVSVSSSFGIGIWSNSGAIFIQKASADELKAGTHNYHPVVPANLDTSIYYGLSKLAGVDLANETVTLGTYPETSKTAIRSLIGAAAASDIPNVPVQDVQVNGTSVVSGDVANVPVASGDNFGVVKVNSNAGIRILNGYLMTTNASDSDIQSGTNNYKVIGPGKQDGAVFYGLSKVAGVDLASETVTLGTYPETSKAAIRSLIGAGTPLDVQINGTSIVSSGTANIPLATTSTFGVVRIAAGMGLQFHGDNYLILSTPNDNEIKQGTNLANAIKPGNQHIATFYGLAKAAGDTSQASSSNTVGTYTTTAAAAIRNMLGATSSNVIAVQDEQPTDNDTKVWLPETEAQGIQVPTYEEFQTLDSSVVKKTDYATTSAYGIVKPGNGLLINSSNVLSIATATVEQCKQQTGSTGYQPITVWNQHAAVFYGLAKAAGDATQSASDNAVGTYTDDAKATICNMLSVASITDLNNKADKNNAVFTNSISMGRKANTTIGETSVAVGNNVQASAVGTFAVGYQTQASSLAAFAEGNSSIANNQAAHAEGWYTTASGMEAHAEGYYTVASGSGSHAEGSQTTASGHYSHASGGATQSLANYSYTAGYGTIAHGICSFIIGKYNAEDKYQLSPEWVADTSYQVGDKIKITTTVDNVTTVAGYICKTANNDNIFTSANWNNDTLRNFVIMVGNGTTNNNQSNAYALDWDGNAYYAGNVYVGCNDDSTGGIRLPHDVQVNGTSVVSNGVANIPIGNGTTLGVVKKAGTGYSINIENDGSLKIVGADSSTIKMANSNSSRPILPAKQHEAVFYGLAKAAGDATQSASSNAVGTYTAEAKAAIHTMLGIDPASIAAQVDIPLVETISGTTPTITGQPNVRYVCGEVSTISITPPASGSVDVIFESGSTATTMTVPSTVKWPVWFDAEALEANTTYEVLITDGIYGSVMTWVT